MYYINIICGMKFAFNISMKKNNKCPFLEEVVVRYCKAFPVKKMIPTNKLLRDDPCIGCPHKCAIYQEVANVESTHSSLTADRSPLLVSTDFSCDANGKETVRGFSFNPALFYLKNHVWLSTDDNKMVKIGFDDFAAKILNRITQVYVLPDGELVSQISINHAGQVINISLPITGKITQSNHTVIANPVLIGENPYDSWIYLIEAMHLETTLSQAQTGHEARKWMDSEINAFQELVQTECASNIADGGELVSDWYKKIKPSERQRLIERFLIK